MIILHWLYFIAYGNEFNIIGRLCLIQLKYICNQLCYLKQIRLFGI